MAFPESAPWVKGPYSERGGKRFRIRICDATGYRDLYFPTLQEARDGMTQAERELSRRPEVRSLREALDEYVKERVRHGLCQKESADQQRERLHRCRATCSAATRFNGNFVDCASDNATRLIYGPLLRRKVLRNA